MPLNPAYIIAARRSAIGRIGGMHQGRRIEALAAPVIEAALTDCGVSPSEIDQVVIGNASDGGNPARLIALAAGILETAPAVTIDRQCASGLDAILNAIRIIGAGEADVILAGGVDSPSTAPWRIAKPKTLHQVPHFIGIEPATSEETDEPQVFEASEALARRLGITREQQDGYALHSHLKAEAARERRRFVGEIVPLRLDALEARDESAHAPDIDDLRRQPPFLPAAGTLTPGNTSAMHDGAAIVVVVSEVVYDRLGRPPALKLVNSAVRGVAPAHEAEAPGAAMNGLYQRLNGFDRSGIGVVEIAEVSAAQALAFCQQFGLDEAVLNPEGGQIVRGHPFGASGAVLVVRLFSQMVRNRSDNAPRFGVAAQGAIGGLGLAALFEAL